jgi:ATP-binding cassette subfamily B protein
MLPWPVQAIIDHIGRSSIHSHDPAARYSLFQFILSSAERFIQSNEFDFLYKNIGWLSLLYLSNAALLYFQNIVLVRLGQRVVLDIRRRLFSHLIALPQNFFEKAQTGDLTSRISKDTADLQDLLEGLLTIGVRSIPTILGILVVSFTLDWIYALTFLLVIPVIYWANLLLTRRTRDAVRKQRSVEGAIASNVQEALYSHKAVATLCLEEDVLEDFVEAGEESALHGVAAGRFQGMLTASMDFLVGATTLVILFVGVLRILHGCLTVGQLLVFLSYLNSLFKPIREISKFTGRMTKSTTALERIEEIMGMDLFQMGATETADAIPAPPFRGHIALRGVTFGYQPDQPILEGVNLEVLPGQKVAFVGDSGSGKSSILSLIMRLYDPWEGQVVVDELDIRRFTLSSLRNQMAIVLQDSFIFNMTIRENIALARPEATAAEVIQAAKAAEADEFIQELPLNYDTPLGEGGAGLSGGQKRRLAIARAILRNSPLVLLDEPTAGLDATSEQNVMEALRRLSQGKTTIVVTHQLSTITDADQIFLISKGKIQESGSHEELLRKGSAYAHLWATQQGESLILTV